MSDSYDGGMLRVSDETRNRVNEVAREDFDGASADEAVRRLLDEHWEARAVAAVEQYRHDNPSGWVDYLADAEELSQADAPVTDGWRE